MPPATLGGPALRVRDWLRRTLDAKLEQALGGPARKRVVLLLAGVLSLTSADMATVGAAPTRPRPAFGGPTMKNARHQPAPSGQQYEIRYGNQYAICVEVGGGLRQYQVDGHDLLDGYPIDQRCTGARGLPLIPWPNRLADGSYHFDGTGYQVPLTEPDKHNAIHGFLRWRNWTCRDQRPDRVTLGTILHPRMGYPFTLDVRVDYRLGQDGLTVTSTATNLGDTACPYACGQHPYLFLGTEQVDPCRLRLEAASWLPTDERGLPTGRRPVAGSPYDFRAGRQIGAQDLDYTFTDLARDQRGRAWVHLAAPDGRHSAVWLDESYPYVEIYTSHTQAPPHWRRGLGVEPMTCAPNAFRTGDGLIRLEPGESTTASWGMRAGLDPESPPTR